MRGKCFRSAAASDLSKSRKHEIEGIEADIPENIERSPDHSVGEYADSVLLF